MLESVQEFVLDTYVREECVPYFPVARLIGNSGFVDSSNRINGTASNNIQEAISLGSYLMWNESAACGGRIDLNIFVRDLSKMWRSL